MHQVSIWEKESFYGHKDIIIIGSGLVGLWSAYFLKKNHPKLSVAIVERGVIPTGASTRNAGFACFGSVTELMADTLKSGEDKMLKLVEMRYKGLKKIKKIFRNKQISYEGFGGHELITAAQGHDINQLRTNIDWLNHKLKAITKKEKAFYLNDDKISVMGFAQVVHLIENRLEGQLHSGKLCQALLTLVQSMGVTVLNAIEVKGFENINGQITLHTQLSVPLSAGQLLVCTNAFARQLAPELEVEPARGQVLVTSEIPNLSWKGTFHYDEGYYYFRDLGQRILLGGARNQAFEEEHTDKLDITDIIQNELERFLHEVILPATVFKIEHRWSGIMGVSDEKMPIVRENAPGVFFAVRMGGMGVALAPVIGEQASEMIAGKK